MANTILQIIKIDPDLIEEIKAAWHRLPETDHADGKYRLRKYSYVECNIDNLVSGRVFITDLKERQFTQSSKYNKHQGDKAVLLILSTITYYTVMLCVRWSLCFKINVHYRYNFR